MVVISDAQGSAVVGVVVSAPAGVREVAKEVVKETAKAAVTLPAGMHARMAVPRTTAGRVFNHSIHRGSRWILSSLSQGFQDGGIKICFIV